MNAYSDLFGPVSENSHCIFWLFDCEGRNPWLKMYVKYYKKKRNSSLKSSHGAGPVDYWLSTKSKITFFIYVLPNLNQLMWLQMWFYGFNYKVQVQSKCHITDVRISIPLQKNVIT